MPTYNEKFKKSISFSLLFFPILTGLMGTITLVVLVSWVIPKEQLQAELPYLLVAVAFIYGLCAISLFLRSIFLKRGSFK
ncbi:hypothetical protein Q73_16690 [Bacillus coahuilensis m2-6]|uniref:hypothetical protein n=1 Tax=Bacillus coahuilensis TaxID=408580 RepID=UPI0007506902|nr:hypothetical protein [Bacillus coahuilensis]KUP03967.1 hypothetical protein Q73_16690 [Bacillus coahuilensis m2-6]